MKLFILSFLLFFVSTLGVIAFNIPDVNSLGKDPVITGVENNYLIPNKIATIYGRNFLFNPLKSNFLFVNGKRAKILSASKNSLNFIVPNVKPGYGKIKFYTQYLGYRSKKVLFPEKGNLELKIPIPAIKSFNTNFVYPGNSVYFGGDFKQGSKIFFQFDNKIIESMLLSRHKGVFVLPDSLPVGLFDLQYFQEKKFKNKNVIYTVKSPLSKNFTFYNLDSGEPYLLKLTLNGNISDSFIGAEYLFTVSAIFPGENEIDVTSLVNVSFTPDDILVSNRDKLIVLNEGQVVLNASLLWEPTSNHLEVNQQFNIVTPKVPMSGDLLINEIYSSPNDDANRDGVLDTVQDEFIEIVNISSNKLDLSGVAVSDKTKVRHIFSNGFILKPFESLVLFGGGKNNNFTASRSQVASGGDLGLNNSGEEIVSIKLNDNILSDVVYDNNNLKGISLNRSVDLTNTNFIQHTSVSTNVLMILNSPGKKANGSNL